MSTQQRYIAKYGPDAGPKLYHALQSRAAYMGVSRRRRLAIEAMQGVPSRPRRARTRPVEAPSSTMPLFPEPEPGSSRPVDTSPDETIEAHRC